VSDFTPSSTDQRVNCLTDVLGNRAMCWNCGAVSRLCREQVKDLTCPPSLRSGGAATASATAAATAPPEDVSRNWKVHYG
jgi:hypothetical protein